MIVRMLVVNIADRFLRQTKNSFVSTVRHHQCKWEKAVQRTTPP